MTDKPTGGSPGFACEAAARPLGSSPSPWRQALRRIPALFSFLAVAMVAAACDIPTAAPEWDTRWIIPAEETTVEVAELLARFIRVMEPILAEEAAYVSPAGGGSVSGGG